MEKILSPIVALQNVYFILWAVSHVKLLGCDL